MTQSFCKSLFLATPSCVRSPKHSFSTPPKSASPRPNPSPSSQSIHIVLGLLALKGVDCVFYLLRHQQILREGPLFIDPLSFAPESCSLRHFQNFLNLVLVRTFRPDRFSFIQHHPQSRGRYPHGLPRQTPQVHFNPPFLRVPTRFMPEAAQIKISAQFPVHPPQQIQIKRRRSSRRIVVCQQLCLNRLLQVGSQQQRIAATENLPHSSQKFVSRVAIEVPNRAAQKQHQQVPFLAP